jgi:hypothetical protein
MPRSDRLTPIGSSIPDASLKTLVGATAAKTAAAPATERFQPAPEREGSGSWRGAASSPMVFLVVVCEDPRQAQAPASSECTLSVLLGRVFTKSLTMRADANSRVLALRAPGGLAATFNA